MQSYKNKRMMGYHMTTDEEELLRTWAEHGHAHSDHDSELDGDPWDEYNKVDKFTSLESKLAKKLN